jgi:RNA polymerase sigma-70 factor, ECF subfamily
MKPKPANVDLEQVFRECGNDLSAYFARRHGGADIAADLVQESFLQLARRIQKGHALQCPRGYLFGIARHISVAFFRRKQPALVQQVDDYATSVAAQPDERVAAAREVIAALPPLQREILDLRFSHGLSYAEIATALGIPAGTVRSRLHHAIALLRERMDAETHRPPPK